MSYLDESGQPVYPDGHGYPCPGAASSSQRPQGSGPHSGRGMAPSSSTWLCRWRCSRCSSPCAVERQTAARTPDGLRITRNLSRMRAPGSEIEQHPLKAWKEYRHRWVRLLGKEAGGFRWHDRNRAIKWKKFAGMRRVDFMLCQILESLEQNRPEYAMAQVVQCMKCLHEFSRQGSWRAAWPLTHMIDPFDMDGHGGDDVEMEVIMSWLRRTTFAQRSRAARPGCPSWCQTTARAQGMATQLGRPQPHLPGRVRPPRRRRLQRPRRRRRAPRAEGPHRLGPAEIARAPGARAEVDTGSWGDWPAVESLGAFLSRAGTGAASLGCPRPRLKRWPRSLR